MTTNPAPGRLTSPYGPRKPMKLPNGTLTAPFHAGADVANVRGTPVRAVQGGRVIHAGVAGAGLTHDRTGLCVLVRHDDGAATYYGHLDTIAVAVGQHVAEAQLLGTMGDTGNASGVHLHLERRPDARSSATTDPLPWLASHGITLGTDQEDEMTDEDRALLRQINDRLAIALGALARLDVWRAQDKPDDVDERAIAALVLAGMPATTVATELLRNGLARDVVTLIGQELA